MGWGTLAFVGAGIIASGYEAAGGVIAAAQSADLNALDVIGTGSQLTVVGVLVLIAHRFATGQLVSRDTAAALSRMDELVEASQERERVLEDLKIGARIREDRLWQLATHGPAPDLAPPPASERRDR